MNAFNENTVELAALEYFAELGYCTLHGPDIAPGEPRAERDSYEEVFLWDRLREAIRRINPGTAPDLIDAALARVRRAESQSPIDENYRLHQLITEGVPVEHREAMVRCARCGCGWSTSSFRRTTTGWRSTSSRL